jgi:hypothetical protein
MNENVTRLVEEISKEMPGTGIILIPPDEEMGITTNILSLKDGSMVVQHMAAVIHLFQNQKLYDAVLDSFEKRGKDLKIINPN